MAREQDTRKGIKDIFYETRVLMGRSYTLRRFSEDILAGSVDPVMLGYIEKGTRFPSESLVRRLAVIRGQDAHELLALLWRDRMLYAFGRELQKVLRAPQTVSGVADADLAVAISEAIAALPDDGSWVPVAQWRATFRDPTQRRSKQAQLASELAERVETTLIERELIEIDADNVRRLGRHFTAQSIEERQTLALEFCTLFLKGMLDKLTLPGVNTGTYLRNHFLDIDPERLPEFQRRLDEAVRTLAEEFAAEPSSQTDFFNVLITGTRY